MLASKIRDNDLTSMIRPSIRFDISLQNFNKLLDIFSPQIEKETFWRIFSYDSGRLKKALSDILALRSSLKKANTRKPA